MRLDERITSLSDEELFLMVNEKAHEYTKEALEIAKEEVTKRNLWNKTMEEIKAKEEEDAENMDEVEIVFRNAMASVLKVIGYLEMVAGIFLFGIFYESNISIGTIFIISGFIGGFLFIGFGEVINLLHQINERQKSNTGV